MKIEIQDSSICFGLNCGTKWMQNWREIYNLPSINESENKDSEYNIGASFEMLKPK